MGALVEINTDGLAKLGETICYGTGLAAFGRKKMANAEAYAAIKQAETEAKVELLKLKGQEEIANYILARESRKMNNVKSVVEKATLHFTEGEKVSDEPVNTDWTNRFFSIVEDISDETLQDIWGRILAGEVKQPNSFSLRTLDLLRNVTKEEAELFVKASRFYVETNFICTEKFALSLHETLLLGEAGFLNSEELIKEWDIEPNSKLEILIDRNTLIILHNDTNKKILCHPSVKKLSKTGIEVLSLVEKTDRNKFYKILTQFFKSKGVSHVFKHEIIEYGENCSYKVIGEELFG
ncbi:MULTISPECIES: DUF2806 domain-containing protein [Bacteroides]|jgi:membrane-fusion protein|uniref:DUF2806 domain-containing protein n=1 Tax=Bacteroides acidifaciens TaxID=85831 RepID=A0A3L7YVL8_9BACE|nr:MULTISPECIES: DUF2806 domain-containing protein [Bacteroides]MBF0731466.1 DUF2806 domain-containing protein [Bacteroides acidifaciens]MBF0833890.1 DUF2806 domain-containing protein [Bacteroides acidifaciens]MBV3813283.1 DUF2806 domain-containing protein [Bacteroides stercoris]MCC0774509.1 DUF2806 domain-containing protein [Bacteroides faecis]NDO54553.1 DUF2806 domain-containing protein [Bacteroides acidifaciens]